MWKCLDLQRAREDPALGFLCQSLPPEKSSRVFPEIRASLCLTMLCVVILGNSVTRMNVAFESRWLNMEETSWQFMQKVTGELSRPHFEVIVKHTQSRTVFLQHPRPSGPAEAVAHENHFPPNFR